MNSRYVLEGVKSILKERGITYKTLGEEIGLSEAGVKKMFQTGDASLSRLLAICDYLGIGLDHLVESLKSKPFEDVKFDEAQQSFFTKNPSYFFFYLKLVYEGQSPEEIKEEFGLSQRSVWKYLKKLDELKLIKLTSGERANFQYSHLKRIETKGRVFERMKSDLAISYIERIFSQDNPEKSRVMMASFQLKEDSQNSLVQDFMNLLETYQRKSDMEKSLEMTGQTKRMSVIFGHSDFSFISGIENL